GERSPDSTTFWSITSSLDDQWRYGDVFETAQLLPGASNHHYTINRFSTLPELSSVQNGRISEIGVYCHEFGHALGLPDLYDASTIPYGFQNAGPGNWSLMSTGAYGGTGATPERPAGLDAWSKRYLDWITSFRPGSDTLVTLQPVSEGQSVLELWSQG